MTTNYQSYLLRIWQDNQFGTWRASLTNISTREWQAFPDINYLFSFLHEQTSNSMELDPETDLQIYQELSESQEGEK